MGRLTKHLKRMALLASLCLLVCTNSGCTFLLLRGFLWDQALVFSKFWQTTPVIPVSPYWSELIEDTYHEEERYGKVMILDPVEGEHAPLFCMDPPTADEIMRTLPETGAGGMPFVAETQLNNVRFTVEPLVDSIGECRFFPLVGPARVHKCHYKCTVYFERVTRSDWPIPFSHSDDSVEVVYIDHDHLIRCAGPTVGTP